MVERRTHNPLVAGSNPAGPKFWRFIMEDEKLIRTDIDPKHCKKQGKVFTIDANVLKKNRPVMFRDQFINPPTLNLSNSALTKLATLKTSN